MNNEALQVLKHAMLIIDWLAQCNEEQLGLLMTHFTQEGTHILAQGNETLSAQMHLLALLAHMQRMEEIS
jgi:hypothetical protein